MTSFLINITFLLVALPLLPSLAMSEDSSGNNFLSNLAQKYAPELRFHEHERFHLGNVEDFISRASLISDDDNGKQELIAPGLIMMKSGHLFSLLDQTVKINGERMPVSHRNNRERTLNKLWLKTPKTKYWDVATGKDMRRTCYAHPRVISDAIEITYIFFYPFNGAAKSSWPIVDDVINSFSIGSHEGDFEHLTLRLSLDGKQILGVRYAAHGEKESSWYYHESKDLSSSDGYKLNKQGQLLAWVALQTHGTHNRAATVNRNVDCTLGCVVGALGILVDETSDKGKRISCQNDLEIIDDNSPFVSAPWLSYRGRFGYFAQGGFSSDGTHSPYFKEWWDVEPGYKK